MGVSGSRSPPLIDSTSAPTLVGILSSASPSLTASSPVKATVAGTADSGLYCVGPGGSAALTPIAPTVSGVSASLEVKRWVCATSTTVDSRCPSRS